jgi:hypothetical protein
VPASQRSPKSLQPRQIIMAARSAAGFVAV